MMKGKQIREGRKLLEWSQMDLCRKAGISLPVLEAVEERGSTFMLLDAQMTAIARAFEAAGIEFTSDGDVMLRRDQR